MRCPRRPATTSAETTGAVDPRLLVLVLVLVAYRHAEPVAAARAGTRLLADAGIEVGTSRGTGTTPASWHAPCST